MIFLRVLVLGVLVQITDAFAADGQKLDSADNGRAPVVTNSKDLISWQYNVGDDVLTINDEDFLQALSSKLKVTLETINQTQTFEKFVHNHAVELLRQKRAAQGDLDLLRSLKVEEHTDFCLTDDFERNARSLVAMPEPTPFSQFRVHYDKANLDQMTLMAKTYNAVYGIEFAFVKPSKHIWNASESQKIWFDKILFLRLICDYQD